MEHHARTDLKTSCHGCGHGFKAGYILSPEDIESVQELLYIFFLSEKGCRDEKAIESGALLRRRKNVD